MKTILLDEEREFGFKEKKFDSDGNEIKGKRGYD